MWGDANLYHTGINSQKHGELETVWSQSITSAV